MGRVDGYKAGIALQDGYLIRTTTLYAGWEPNCCPGGLLLTGYTLRGDVLEPVAQWRMGDISMAGWMLSGYFSSWRLQRYLNSYRLLDDATRDRVPYGEWRRQQDRRRIEPDEDVDITPILAWVDAPPQGVSQTDGRQRMPMHHHQQGQQVIPLTCPTEEQRQIETGALARGNQDLLGGADRLPLTLGIILCPGITNVLRLERGDENAQECRIRDE